MPKVLLHPVLFFLFVVLYLLCTYCLPLSIYLLYFFVLLLSKILSRLCCCCFPRFLSRLCCCCSAVFAAATKNYLSKTSSRCNCFLFRNSTIFGTFLRKYCFCNLYVFCGIKCLNCLSPFFHFVL